MTPDIDKFELFKKAYDDGYNHVSDYEFLKSTLTKRVSSPRIERIMDENFEKNRWGKE